MSMRDNEFGTDILENAHRVLLIGSRRAIELFDITMYIVCGEIIIFLSYDVLKVRSIYIGLIQCL